MLSPRIVRERLPPVLEDTRTNHMILSEYRIQAIIPTTTRYKMVRKSKITIPAA